MMIPMFEYVPFRDCLWGSWDYWYVMLLPLTFLISLVYKAMRVEHLGDLPRQTAKAFVKFIGTFLAIAAILWGLGWITR